MSIRNTQNNIEGFYVYRAIPPYDINDEYPTKMSDVINLLQPSQIVVDENKGFEQPSEIIGIFISRVIQPVTINLLVKPLKKVFEPKTMYNNREKITIYTYIEFENVNNFSANLMLSSYNTKFLEEFKTRTINTKEEYENFKKDYPNKVFEMYDVNCRHSTNCEYSESFKNFVNTLFGILESTNVEVFKFSNTDNIQKEMIDNAINEGKSIQVVDKTKISETNVIDIVFDKNNKVKYTTDQSNLIDVIMYYTQFTTFFEKKYKYIEKNNDAKNNDAKNNSEVKDLTETDYFRIME